MVRQALEMDLKRLTCRSRCRCWKFADVAREVTPVEWFNTVTYGNIERNSCRPLGAA
jgi:hypothetical protein